MLQCARRFWKCEPAPFAVRSECMHVLQSQPIRVAMLARVVFPLHGFGGIERHVFHLVTHLARLGASVTLYVQDEARGLRLEASDLEAATSLKSQVSSLKFLRYDYTSQ